MCELFALSASAPVDIKLSFAELARHGGETNIHADGWGVAFLEGKDARVIREPVAAASSPWVQCLQTHPVRSDTVVAHIRHATQGRISLANTQPFVRELAGCAHVFAHNGNLGADDADTQRGKRYRPIGETDSEAAFCDLMDRLASARDREASDAHGMDLEVFSVFARQVRSRGPANVILASNGRLLVHADRRMQQSGVIAPPGLWMLQRACGGEQPRTFDASGVAFDGPALTVVLVASVPLSAEAWEPLPRGTVLAVMHGRIVKRVEV